MDLKLKLSNTRIEGKKSNKQKGQIDNIMNIYDARYKVIKFYKDYSAIVHNARYDATHEREVKILTHKQMFQRFPIVLAKVKAGNISENLLNGTQ